MAETKSTVKKKKVTSRSKGKATNNSVDQKTIDALNKAKQEQELKLIKSQFVEWSNKSVEELLGERNSTILSSYEFGGFEYLVRVFDYRPSKKDEDEFDLNINSAGDKLESYMHRYFPICRVLAKGELKGDGKKPDKSFEVGDFVKISDFHAMTIDNPHYEHWVSNGGNKAKGQEKIGTEPPRLMSNLKSSFGEYMFIIDFLKTKLDVDDYVTFKLPTSKLQNKIKDIKIYESLLA